MSDVVIQHRGWRSRVCRETPKLKRTQNKSARMSIHLRGTQIKIYIRSSFSAYSTPESRMLSHSHCSSQRPHTYHPQLPSHLVHIILTAHPISVSPSNTCPSHRSLPPEHGAKTKRNYIGKWDIKRKPDGYIKEERG